MTTETKRPLWRRILRRLEPDYNWGRTEFETMDLRECVPVFYFEWDWLGFAGQVWFGVGRRKTAREGD